MASLKRETRIADAVEALTTALKPEQTEVHEALERLLAFVPEIVPKQFTDANVFPYGPQYFNKKEQAEDAKQVFFSEAYLYTLLGKDDARTLRGRMRAVLTALGFSDDQIREWM